MSLITNLNKYESSQNKDIVDSLISFLEDSKIDTLDELIKFQDLSFMVNDKFLQGEDRVIYYYNLIKDSFIEYDGLALEEVREIRSLKDSLITNISLKEKIKNIIKYATITHREIKFYADAYNLIINGEL